MAARHHHYLSQCYLRGFTSGNAKNSNLLVFDFKQKKHFETTPRNVGGVRDFNRIDIQGFPQDYIETKLAEFESIAATALKKVSEGELFEGRHREVILNLVALLASRSPERRASWNEFHARVAEQIMSMSLATKERWEGQMEQMKAAGRKVNEDVSYEDMKKFVESKEYSIEAVREHHIHMEMVAVETILPLLLKRKWHTVRATDKSGPFITTDSPVVLMWNDPESIPPFNRNSPGYGMKNTQVFFPISSSVAIIGAFEQEEIDFEADESLIAKINTIFMNFFNKQIYVPKLGFKFEDPQGETKDGRYLIKHLYSK